MMERKPISCRAAGSPSTALWKQFAARKVCAFKRAVLNLASYIENNKLFQPICIRFEAARTYTQAD